MERAKVSIRVMQERTVLTLERPHEWARWQIASHDADPVLGLDADEWKGVRVDGATDGETECRLEQLVLEATTEIHIEREEA